MGEGSVDVGLSGGMGALVVEIVMGFGDRRSDSIEKRGDQTGRLSHARIAIMSF
jgi:hypothetical protein